MAGYGYYDEEETGEGLLTGGLYSGGAARAKKRFVFGPSVPTGKIGITTTGKRVPIRRPTRLGMHIEYASKKLYNRNLQAKNEWLKRANADPEIKKLRKQVGERMRQIAAEYRKTLSPEKAAKLEAAAKKRKTKAQRYKEAEDAVASFKQKYPDPTTALRAKEVLGLNRKAKMIILKTVYGLSDDEIKKLLPPRPRFTAMIKEGELIPAKPEIKVEVTAKK